MTLITISKSTVLTAFYNLRPFVFVNKTGDYTLADFWTTTFGAPDESTAATKNVEQVVQDSLLNYEMVDSLVDAIAQKQSFFFDFAAQLLYIHVGAGCDPFSSRIEEGSSRGFSDKIDIYVDGIEFSPRLLSAPSIAQSEDIMNHDRMSFIVGNVVLSMVGGDLDELLDEPLLGNSVQIYSLKYRSGVQDYSVNDIVQMAAVYIEDYAMSQKKLTLRIQDIRSSGNIKIPNDFFTVAEYPYLAETFENAIIPAAYGLIRASRAIPVNSTTTGTTIFRQALMLTSLGTVQVKVGDVWVDKTPTATNLSEGSFTLAAIDSRSGAQVYECRVLGSVGVAVVHASDVIKHINDEYGGVPFNSSSYNLSEWAAAEAALEPIGILFDKEVELFEAIRLIQNGANIGFRYEIDANGKRTIRIDDNLRDESFSIRVEDILDIDELEFETDRDFLAASIKVLYAPDFNDGSSLIERSDDNYDYVKEKYRLIPTLEFSTYLTTAEDAAARAALEADKYMDIAKFISIQVFGDEYMRLRIFDVGTVEATRGFVDLDGSSITGPREWLGVWKAKVVSIDPDMARNTNKVTLALISKKF